MSFLNLTNKDEFIRVRCRDISASKEDFERNLYNKKKQTVPFTYFSPKQFDEYVEFVENDEQNPTTIKVIGNVRIYKNKYVDIKEDQDFDNFVEQKKQKNVYGCVELKYSKQYIDKHQKKLNGEKYKKFDLYEAKDHRCYGYAEVEKNKFVRLQKRNPFLIILFFLLSLCLLVGIGFILDEKLPDFPNVFELFDIDNTVDYDGEKNSSGDSQIIQETYEIPYTPYVELSEKDPNLYLVNPDSNTVYFMYTLYIDTNGNGTIENNEAVDENGNSKAIYKTKLIPPGQMIEANLYTLLGPGEYKVVQKINAFNYAPGKADDQSPCNGSNLTTKIKIE